ncbi:long-chain-fatty-acid--CoA ligase 5 isoform X1 [Amyelois transitella]|uniref:long-chain-fatty-acid--CoA ligase 5 isoform X1 n=1 Tax=Amyelois transitella TaxID=680683 RepID=UPI00067AA8AD|nr:long-chain-fatty-acid--CoA ligase 5 isoform X1 [Amyelois transitella]XP_060804822.1 long-chain-fatty-acid--CoA ligase 5 isoform X1 [Amyelois transitella]
MGSGKFSFSPKKDKVSVTSAKAEISVKEKCHKIQKKLKKTETKKTDADAKEKKIWWNQCSSLSEIDQYLWMVGGSAGALALTGVAAASAFYLSTRPKPEKPLVTLHEQSLLETGPEMVRVSKFYKDAKNGRYLRYLHDDTRTLYETFRRGVKESNNGNCLGWREGPNKPYVWQTYNETLLRAKNFGSGLICQGLSPGQNTFVGIYSQNCPEWIMTEQAAYCYSMVIVPLYDTLGANACSFIVNQTEMAVVVCEDDKKANLLLDQSPRCLRKLITIKEVSPSTHQRAKSRGVEIVKFSDVEIQGAQKDYPCVPPQPESLCTICYTSGTTGMPKGVMLTHENVVASVCSVMMQLGEHKPSKHDVMISFLPLAHMLERCCENALYMVGGAVGFYSGDMRRLADDLSALKPTMMPAVPRLLNRLYDKAQAEISSSKLKKLLFNMALSAKESELKRGIIRSDSIWDKLVFRKVREGMGGRLRIIVVGSAPLAGNVLTFARCALGCLIVEGYGQTECTAPVTLTVQGDHVPEHVGPPVACCKVKLVDVPEMEYYAAQGQGEVCVQGANVFKGYFKDHEKTKEVIDHDGWHHTGDVGKWLPNGTLKIIDRRKHIFKLSQGEYIVPEKIENIYIRSQYVEQVFVHGESLKSCVIAIVVPDVDVVKCWALENGIKGTFSALCENEKVKKMILDDMLQWGKTAGLKTFEQVKDIYLHPDPFSVQNGLLTPTLKAKRPEIRSYFKPQIEDMYKQLA